MNREGEINTNYQGCKMKIIKYNNTKDMNVLFIDTNNIKKHTEYRKFKSGKIKNRFYPDVANIGYIGDIDNISKNGIHFYSYRVWRDMIYRCYNKREQKKKPCYIGCKISKEWLCYSNFKKWYDLNCYIIPDGEPLNLDKDILFKNNKLYSEKTCILVPKSINQIFIRTGNTVYSQSYADNKYKIIHEKLKKYENVIPNDIYNIILNYKLEIKGDK